MMKKTAAFAKIEELLQTNQRWHFNFISNPHVFSELLCENRSWCLLVQCFVSLFFFALILTAKLRIHFVTHLVIFWSYIIMYKSLEPGSESKFREFLKYYSCNMEWQTGQKTFPCMFIKLLLLWSSFKMYAACYHLNKAPKLLK